MKVLLTSGMYSDYVVHGFYEVPSTEWMQERLADWLAAHPEQLQDYCFHEVGFVEWLGEHAEFQRVEYREVHLGRYSKIKGCEIYVDQLMRDRGVSG